MSIYYSSDERKSKIIQGLKDNNLNNFDFRGLDLTDLDFRNIDLSNVIFFNSEDRKSRIALDHLKSSAFLIADGVRPSNTAQGYILRKLIRSVSAEFYFLIDNILEKYFHNQAGEIKKIFLSEIKNLNIVNSQISNFIEKKLLSISGKERKEKIIYALQTLGFSKDLFREELFNRFAGKDKEELIKYFDIWVREAEIKHREISRQGYEKKFKGGLAGESNIEASLHTATHILLAGLKIVLGPFIVQKGQNITAERIRFDFNFDRKLTSEEKEEIENYVNGIIKLNCSVEVKKMKKDEAQLNSKITGSFWDRYPENVTIYLIIDTDGRIHSQELCGGPHVQNTKNLGNFRIIKDESSSLGIRRIKAILE